ncbi:MAG: pyridoxal phosphate-dependent aminotransferase [Betaproteobacteria bacterium]
MRELVDGLQESLIRVVANAALDRPDVLKFWFGESDEVTPTVIREAASASLSAGETFYSHNLGLPELRHALAAYSNALRPAGAASLSSDRIAVTSGGVNGLMIAAQSLVDAGDRVVVVTPVWPNLVAQPRVMGARVHTVSLRPRQGAWSLDMEELLEALTPDTRALVINSPNNPTGWTLSGQEQAQILSHARTTGLWIVADEVYERLYFDAGPGACAPSFLDLATAEDRLVVVNSFSKSFLMTGWRLGWLTLPPTIMSAVGKLLEFNTSCAPVFVQRAGLAALHHADQITPEVVGHLRRCRDTLVPLLSALPTVEVAAPPGGLYAFLRVAAHHDSLLLAKRLVQEAGLGLAPGNAFFESVAPQMQGWLRWCFASADLARLRQGVERLERWLRL